MRIFLALVIALAASHITVAAEPITAGVAVVDITPPVGYRLSGYFYERHSTGQHDPLLAKAMYLKQGETEIAFVFCDLIGQARSITDAARNLATKQSGIPREHILIAATHSHTGPLFAGALRDYFHARAVATHGKDVAEEVDYPQELASKLADATAQAKQSARPTALRVGQAEQQGLSFNRRFHMKDGSVVFNPGKLNTNIVRVAGPIDPEVGLVRLDDAKSGEPFAALSVFALHLDTVGGTEYSGDYPSYLSRELQAKFGEKFVSLFGAGTCGDINHIDVSHDRPQKGHEEAERIGSELAKTILAAWPKLELVETPKLAAQHSTVLVPRQSYAAEEVEKARENMAKIGGRELSFLEQVETVKIVALENYPADGIALEVQAFRLSDDTALVGLPGEVFVDLGLAIKTGSPFKNTIVIELCQDAPAYIPTRKAFAEGSYETVNSRVKPGGGEAMVEAAVKLLKQLK